MKNLVRMTFIAVFGIALLCAVSVSRVEAALILVLDDISTVGEDAGLIILLDGADNDLTVDISSENNVNNTTYGYYLNGSDVFTAFDLDNGDTFEDGDTLDLALVADGWDAQATESGDWYVVTLTFDGIVEDNGDGIDGTEDIYSTLEVEWDFSDGQFIKYTFNTTEDGFSPVPEPGTIVLLGIGLVGLVGAGVRKQRNRNKKS